MFQRLGALITLTAAALLAGTLSPLSAQQVLVRPYVQPGDGGPLGKADVKVIAWLTDQLPGDYTVELDLPGAATRTVRPERVALDFARAVEKPKAERLETANPDDPVERVGPLPPEREQHYFRYVARLGDLPFNKEVRYRVKQAGAVVRESTFRTRATADRTIRFAVVGDLANGKNSQNTVAFRIAQERPEFLIALGDLVYPNGRVNQYLHHFWRTYNDVETPGPKAGAPLMASVPFYPVLGNHDVDAKLPAVPDALGIYYFFQPPRNGPGPGPWNSQLGADGAVARKFREVNADSYPALDAYSFDYGPAHVLVLNSNQSKNVDEPRLRQWVEADLKASRAPWKFVCCHNPAFSSSTQHYTEQAVRLWHPLFEACGVDVVFAGHVHNYQRTVPIRFAPASPKRDKRGRVDGVFTLDREFDGETNTRPRGVIHVVAGGGGATLYGPGLDKTAPSLRKEHGENYADYTARQVVDRHSFVVVELTPERFTLRAVDADGQPLDRVVITKPGNQHGR